jgi:hypothetical protein
VLPAYARTGSAVQFELTCWHFAMLPHRARCDGAASG